MTKPCAVEDCARDSRRYGYCTKHSAAFARHGDPLVNAALKHSPGERYGAWVLVDRNGSGNWLCRCDCGAERVQHLSSLTQGKSKSCGDLAFHPHNAPSGAAKPNWSGDHPGYGAMHSRVRKARGPSRLYPCAHCGGQACDWAYDHTDPNELHGMNGTYLAPYSNDPARYLPLCRPCHTVFDLVPSA